jgi:hypothetical protein
MKSMCYVTLLLASLAWGQDIVLKAEFQIPAGIHMEQTMFPIPIDINDDGIKDIPTGSQPLMFVDPVTMITIYTPQNNSGYANGNCYRCPISTRRDGLAEYIFGQTIRDYITNEILVANLIGDRYYVLDYDNDGIDDVVVVSTYPGQTCQVYGIATGNPPIAPPQELDIQQVGADYVISWSSVPSATAYRIEWSSALDGVGYTRIGYTTGTTFTHCNQTSQERGFYRVLSEDNGTGVVRMVGRSGADR